MSEHQCCEHELKWHHESRGCGYHGYGSDRCPCLNTFDEALEAHDRSVRAAALVEAADILEAERAHANVLGDARGAAEIRADIAFLRSFAQDAGAVR